MSDHHSDIQSVVIVHCQIIFLCLRRKIHPGQLWARYGYTVVKDRWDRTGWRRPGGMPCVVCREVVVGAVCATVHATDDYLRWASSHCARTPATANGDPALAQPKPAHRGVRRPLISTTPVSDARRHLPRTIRAQRAQRAPSRASSFPCTSTRTSFRPSPMALHKFT